MSEETDKVMSDASGCDEDEEWLYGGDNDEKPEESADEETVDNTFTEPTVKEAPTDGVQIEENGKVEEDSESDSDEDDDDDDVCVTIGDITTGGLSQYTNFGAAPVNLNIKSDGRAHAIVGTKTKGVDLNAPGSVNGIPVLEADIESFEEKPWRKPGADISDYFNYGFNEDSWKSYCEKQRRTRGSYEGTSLSSAKNMGQQGRSGYGDKESRYDYASLGSQNKSAQRKSSGTIDVIGGQTGSISRLEGRRRHNNEGNNIQVLSEASQDADSSAAKISPFFPPNIPPPPFPPPPHSVSSAPPLIPPPHIPISVPPPGYPPGAPPPSLMQSLNSGHSGGYEGPIMPPFPFPPGVFPRLASWPGAMDSAKAWEHYARQGRDRERNKDRSRERGHDKEREQGRDREREPSPSSQPNNSEEEQQRQRHRDHGERGYDRHRDRFSRETEERHREKRRRDEGRHKPPRSSSSSKRKHGSEEGDSSRRHRHKKTKRSKEEKEERHKLSTDQENQSEPTD